MILGAVLLLALALLLWLMEKLMGRPRRTRCTELTRFPGNATARERWTQQHENLPFEERHRLPEPSEPRVKL